MTRLRTRRCWYCGCPLLNTFPERDQSKTRDHVVPRSQGGRRTVMACRLCNSAKGALSLDEYRTRVGRGLFFGEGGDVAHP